MLKTEELMDPQSCLSRARFDERLFVLLARDVAAPVAIRSWVAERLRLGKNQPGDSQITEALDCADRMERERAARGTSPEPLSTEAGRQTVQHKKV